MKYRANPVIVDAFKIITVLPVLEDGTLPLILEDGRTVEANLGMTSRYIPIYGDYWVMQEDGYVYLNKINCLDHGYVIPRDVFLRKYLPE